MTRSINNCLFLGPKKLKLSRAWPKLPIFLHWTPKKSPDRQKSVGFQKVQNRSTLLPGQPGNLLENALALPGLVIQHLPRWAGIWGNIFLYKKPLWRGILVRLSLFRPPLVLCRWRKINSIICRFWAFECRKKGWSQFSCPCPFNFVTKVWAQLGNIHPCREIYLLSFVTRQNSQNIGGTYITLHKPY